MKPYLYGFNQGFASPISLRANFISIYGKSALALRVIAIPYTIWSLDVFRSLLKYCLDLTTLQSLQMDYAIAIKIYPLLLVLITYLVTSDRASCQRLLSVSLAVETLHRCCVRFTTMMDIKSSVVKA